MGQAMDEAKCTQYGNNANGTSCLCNEPLNCRTSYGGDCGAIADTRPANPQGGCWAAGKPWPCCTGRQTGPTCVNAGGGQAWQWAGAAEPFNMDDTGSFGCSGPGAPSHATDGDYYSSDVDSMRCSANPGLRPVKVEGESGVAAQPLPSGHRLTYVLRHQGQAPCQISNTGHLFASALDNSLCTASGWPFWCCTGAGAGTCGSPSHGGQTYCVREYKRWENHDLPGEPFHGCPPDAGCIAEPNHDCCQPASKCCEPQQKILTFYSCETNGCLNGVMGWKAQISISPQGSGGGTIGRIEGGSNSAFMGYNEPGSFGNVVQDCINNFCRFEACIDYDRSTGLFRTRRKMTKVSPGTFAEFPSFDGAIAQGNIPRFGTMNMHDSYTSGSGWFGQFVPNIVSYMTHFITTGGPYAPNFWIGPACEVEGGCDGFAWTIDTVTHTPNAACLEGATSPPGASCDGIGLSASASGTPTTVGPIRWYADCDTAVAPGLTLIAGCNDQATCNTATHSFLCNYSGYGDGTIQSQMKSERGSPILASDTRNVAFRVNPSTAGNVAPVGASTASSVHSQLCNGPNCEGPYVTAWGHDGSFVTEWVTGDNDTTPNPNGPHWFQLDWPSPGNTIKRIILYDRKGTGSRITGGTITITPPGNAPFTVGALPDDGTTGLVIDFDGSLPLPVPQAPVAGVTRVRFDVTSAVPPHFVGLSEIEVIKEAAGTEEDWDITSFSQNPTTCTNGAPGCVDVLMSATAAGTKTGDIEWSWDCNNADGSGVFTPTIATGCANSVTCNSTLHPAMKCTYSGVGQKIAETRSARGLSPTITDDAQTAFNVTAPSWNVISPLTLTPSSCEEDTCGLISPSITFQGTATDTELVTTYDRDSTTVFSSEGTLTGPGCSTIVGTIADPQTCAPGAFLDYTGFAPGNYQAEIRQEVGGVVASDIQNFNVSSIGGLAHNFSTTAKLSSPSATLTFSRTISGSNLLSILSCATDGAVPITAAYDGLPTDFAHQMTPISSIAYQTFNRAIMLGKRGPAAGTDTITVTAASPTIIVCTYTAFTGADQIQGWKSPVTALNSAASGVQPSVVVPAIAGEIVIDSVAFGQNSAGSKVATAAGGQTERGEDSVINTVGGASSTRVGAPPSVTMSWSIAPVNADWSSIGVAICDAGQTCNAQSGTWQITVPLALSQQSCQYGSCGPINTSATAAGDAVGGSGWTLDCNMADGFMGIDLDACEGTGSVQNCNQAASCNMSGLIPGVYIIRIQSQKGGQNTFSEAPFIVSVGSMSSGSGSITDLFQNLYRINQPPAPWFIQ